MKTTLKTSLLSSLSIFSAFAQITYAQDGDSPATGSEQSWNKFMPDMGER